MGDEEDDGVCNTRLELGIGLDHFVPEKKNHYQQEEKINKSLISLDLSFPSHGIGSKTINGEEEESQSDSSNNMNNDHNKDDDDDGNGGHVRKKLRLTKEQYTVLEDSFKQHTTIDMAQKKELAEKLKLEPRQIEVWFQNRKARTKLKQSVIDCEFLKKCCKNLSEENQRLKKQLQELRSAISTTSTPFFAQLQKEAAETTIVVCPYCKIKMIAPP